ncbi:aminotransferase class V-fold PLP-dependent enzyme [Mycolicibacterium elephantis]|uniref:Aspartate aminotransferase family protein n=1 Tax=Mycolicibacterium elephantis TaxID=81858 RepID=A0A0M2ZFG8_9MYCO|nr:aminotransferase class V-fold PLP-dependent enzyme [Mycolicibacterium elephantis]KKW62935.1 pyridoxal-dependent decarboxylase [Mycolicibacterium elephantis]OBB19188.1 pyridoxal-dependent decarboxylase [Mycolicibacterium elephantis]ORA65444.1 aspartate aminotransferase family protein [Mycolicibacterium elephantis]
MNELLAEFAERAGRYLSGLQTRSVPPTAEAVEALSRFTEPLPERGADARELLRLLDEIGSPATVATTGGRYFGFVTGAVLPAALAANLLAGVWDQNGAYRVMSPVAAHLEEVAMGWLLDVLGLPADAGAGFVGGATTANIACLAAARHALLRNAGWNVEEDGLFGAPPIRVVVGDEVHASVLKALSLLGLGRSRIERVPVDGQGRMRADALPELSGDTLVCIQAGNVNTGAFDPAEEVCAAARAAGAWVHVDGAFGLWASASPRLAPLAAGFADADSWAADAHKWLNVPYDSGIAFVREAEHLRAAMSVGAAYLLAGDDREPCHYTPDMSRRARGIEIWAALRSLGRAGTAELIERCCHHAARFAEGFRAAGHQVLNDVVLNQVLVSFGDDETTRRVVAGVQTDGTCWFGGTVWQGRAAMRVSVSSWATTDEDVERSLAAVLRIAADG